MPLTKHDAEEETRQILGRIYDARESVGHARSVYGQVANKDTAQVLISCQDAQINRQAELIAKLNELLRQAIS